MTRLEIIAAARQIAQAVEEIGIADLLDRSAAYTLQDFLKSFKQYNILAEKFSDGALFLEKELGFAALREPDPWIQMSNPDELSSEHPFRHLEGVISTLRAVGNMLEESAGGARPDTGRDTLTLVLYEHEGTSSTPRRICDALESIGMLYEACARIQHRSFDDLGVVSCDAGGDKLFVFEGDSGVISSLKGLILSIWERIVFYRERSLQERISLLTHSLPILDQVAEMELHGSIAGADAEQTRKAVVSGVKRFLLSGSMMQEVQRRDTIDERALLIEEHAPRASGVHAPAPAPAAAATTASSPSTMPPRSQAPTPSPAPQPALARTHEPVAAPVVPQYSAPPTPEPMDNAFDVAFEEAPALETDLAWDGILEDDLKTLRELIDKTKRTEDDLG